MHLSYVTPLWSGLGDLLAGDGADARGMPAFVRPLRYLCEQGHTVDLIVLVKPDQARPFAAPAWLTGKAIFVPHGRGGISSRASALVRSVWRVAGELRVLRPDLVYCHGALGVVGCAAARLTGHRHALRLYGTFLAPYIERGRFLRAAFKYPTEVLALRMSGSFVIMTNDGTRGDVVLRALSSAPAQSRHFLLNGVDATVASEPVAESQSRDYSRTLLYPARIARWKGQSRAVSLLKRLTDCGHDLQLLFVGHVSEPDYLEVVRQQASELGVESRVHFGPPMSGGELSMAYRSAVAVVSLYDLSNLGNVAIEALSNGALLASLADGSLSSLSGASDAMVLAASVNELAVRIDEVLRDGDSAARIRSNAVRFSAEHFTSWIHRASVEERILARAIGGDL